MNKNCIIYHYCEVNSDYRKNLLHFLTFGYREELDFYIVIAGKCTVDFPKLPNIHVIFVPNKNYDYGGYAWLINKVIPISLYDNFIFLNCTVRGPFLPSFITSWTDPYLRLLKNDVGIVGSTINILSDDSEDSLHYQSLYSDKPPFSHVQTMVFALPTPILKKLQEDNFFVSDVDWNKKDVVTNFEIRLSRQIISYGYNIRCLIPRYNEIDYRGSHSDINPTSALGDAFFPNRFFGRTLHPFETIFVKTGRNLFEDRFLNELSNNCFFILNDRIILSKSIKEFIKNICQDI